MSLSESLKTESFDEVKELLEESPPLDIENLVFEGGGAKGMFYVGAIKVGIKNEEVYVRVYYIHKLVLSGLRHWNVVWMQF